ITRPSAGYVVIRGTAGSGKTTVALHRIAYLAFDERAIDSPETLVVVFSPALRDYVSHVLPALHVSRVQVRTFHEWASEQCRRLRASQLRSGSLPGRAGRPLRYRHVAIDEVQDFSPLEVRVLLGCLDERRSITLAGDTQQHLLEEGGFTSWAAFLAELGLAGA